MLANSKYVFRLSECSGLQQTGQVKKGVESPVEKLNRGKKSLHPDRDDKAILLIWKAVIATEGPES